MDSFIKITSIILIYFIGISKIINYKANFIHFYLLFRVYNEAYSESILCYIHQVEISIDITVKIVFRFGILTSDYTKKLN